MAMNDENLAREWGIMFRIPLVIDALQASIAQVQGKASSHQTELWLLALIVHSIRKLKLRVSVVVC